MSGIASLAVAIGAALAAILSLYTAWRAAKRDRAQESADSAAVLLGGWETIHDTTKQDLADLRKEYLALKAEHKSDRLLWEGERARMQAEIEELRAQIAIWNERVRRIQPP